MKLITVVFGLILLSMLSLFFSCGKKDSCVAGTGGDVTFKCYPQHHSKPIYNYAKPGYPDSVWIKFNTQEFQGPYASAYDLIATGNSGEDFVTVPNMKCGNYFIYMTGWDTSINYRVFGGIPLKVTVTNGLDSIAVPVSEQ